jgi:ribosomal protein S18 acetylase RimI-like enzyme
LLVHRNYRKIGIATKLVQSILNNHTIKQLTTYFRENFEQQTHVAINFFKKNGFVEFERSKGLSKNLESLSIGSQLLEIPVNFEIKNVNIEDAQEVQGACDLFADKEIQDMTHDTPEFMKNQSPYWNNQTFIAKTCEGKVCGFINSDMDGDFPINSSKTIITSLAIHKDYRNCGLATLLMQNIESLSLAQKIKKLELWLIADNEKALKCYKKFGFIEFSTSIGMRKTL